MSGSAYERHGLVEPAVPAVAAVEIMRDRLVQSPWLRALVIEAHQEQRPINGSEARGIARNGFERLFNERERERERERSTFEDRCAGERGAYATSSAPDAAALGREQPDRRRNGRCWLGHAQNLVKLLEQPAAARSQRKRSGSRRRRPRAAPVRWNGVLVGVVDHLHDEELLAAEHHNVPRVGVGLDTIDRTIGNASRGEYVAVLVHAQRRVARIVARQLLAANERCISAGPCTHEFGCHSSVSRTASTQGIGT